MGSIQRFVPRSITAQITGIVAVSVLLGIVVTIAIVVFVFGTTVPRDTPSAVASRIAQVTRIVRAAKDPAEIDTILVAIRNAGVRVDRVAISDLEALPDNTGLPFRSLPFMRQLESEPGVRVLEGVRYAAGPEQQLAVRLDNDHALVFDAKTTTTLWRFLMTPTALVLTIVLVFILLLSVYAVRWITAPLAAVARAAQSFGRSPQDSQIIGRRGPREIAQVADALNEMRTRIRALLDDRTRMLAAISHDLRTPLTRLRLRAERVTQEGLRDSILGDLVNVSRMLDETLDYLRDDGKSEPMSRVDLPSVLQTICWDFTDVGHAVSYQGPPRLAWTVQPRALTRALTNIVENGVKHGNTVAITLRSTLHERVEIEIADDGAGIPAALHDKVFEPFFKADNARSQNGGGFGLGLSIAQEIVKRHGGVISLLVREPVGLVVQIVLPAEISLSVA
ncbi:ATP-binding protein [Bradyrhizobium canariense]|uniref:histidine kinase n=1 Tax=Bradyrhizobium canariense TaxID=255045 RepID=A0A1H1URW1_9BRAD|nr:ATP-binding protein [Bradyrhizobium canariense]SDS74599.1 Signal transduction histidine kinase [Bradyrhizobium canariense]